MRSYVKLQPKLPGRALKNLQEGQNEAPPENGDARESYDSKIGPDTRAYDLMETIYSRIFASPKGGFDHAWVANALVPGLEAAFWDGRPDIAHRLAEKAVAHYRKYQLDFYRQGFPRITSTFETDTVAERRPWSGDPPSWDYIVPLAVLGDRAAIEQEVHRWPNGFSNRIDFNEGDGSDSTALLLAATLPPDDAIATIDMLTQWRFAPSFKGEYSPDKAVRPRLAPLSYFTLSLLKGDSDEALHYLQIGVPNSDPAGSTYWQPRIIRALRFAVATNRPSLALQLAGYADDSRETLVALNRLTLNHPDDASIRTRVKQMSDAFSGGWRPKDADQARRVWRWIYHNPAFDDEQQYGPFPTGLGDMAKTAPEKLPAELAGHAAILWMGALAVQAAD